MESSLAMNDCQSSLFQIHASEQLEDQKHLSSFLTNFNVPEYFHNICDMIWENDLFDKNIILR